MQAAHLVSNIQQRTQEILHGVLAGVTRVALVDFPNHHNAGDSLIYLGEREYLNRMGIDLAYVTDVARYNPTLLRSKVPEGPVLIQGGGNLGDTWIEIQEFRERVISDLHDRNVIQLAQSVRFKSLERAERARRIFESHPNFTLMVRELESERRAKQLFPNTNIVYCPDLAYGIGLQSSRLAKAKSVGLLRDDLEKAQDTESLASEVDLASDWGWEGSARPLWRLIRVPGVLARKIPVTSRRIYPAVEAEYAIIAKTNLRQAVKKLERGRVVVTDRLHAGVLGALMQRTVVLVDNDYGKLSAMYEDYLGKFPGVHYAGTSDSALELVRALV